MLPKPTPSFFPRVNFIFSFSKRSRGADAPKTIIAASIIAASINGRRLPMNEMGRSRKGRAPSAGCTQCVVEMFIGEISGKG